MTHTPLEHFHKCFTEELQLSKAKIPAACCLSTIGTDGYPNARFVSLKGILDDRLIVTGTLTSRKGVEIKLNDKVALTFWWNEIEMQVRVQGRATPLNQTMADHYFAERNRESQIVSIASDQGRELTNLDDLTRKYQEIETAYQHMPVPRPDNWGGYMIEPLRMEFLKFSSSRFHERTLFECIDGQWNTSILQP